MPTFKERYLAGEYEAVWHELQALGPNVRNPTVYADAVAVAQETMQRVRSNLFTLVDRLEDLNFRFGKDGEWEGQTLVRERFLYNKTSYQVLLGLPLPDAQERINTLEAQQGVLPISLRAFYEVVGSVNLCGYFYIAPDDWERHDLAALPQDTDRETGLVPETLDPLQVFPFDTDLLNDGAEEESDFATLYIAPDPLAKMGYSALGSFETIIPCETMDGYVWIEEPSSEPELLFVNLLRQAFRYGGFNHLSPEAWADSGRETAQFLRALRTPTGQSYLDYLTQDLLAF